MLHQALGTKLWFHHHGSISRLFDKSESIVNCPCSLFLLSAFANRSKLLIGALIKKFHHVRHVMMKKSIRWNITVIKSPNYAVYLCFIDLMKFHQTIVEISSNQCWNFIKSVKFLKFIWWKFYNFMTEILQMFDEFSSIFSVQKGKRKEEGPGVEPETLWSRVWYPTSVPILLLMLEKRK